MCVPVGGGSAFKALEVSRPCRHVVCAGRLPALRGRWDQVTKFHLLSASGCQPWEGEVCLSRSHLVFAGSSGGVQGGVPYFHCSCLSRALAYQVQTRYVSCSDQAERSLFSLSPRSREGERNVIMCRGTSGDPRHRGLWSWCCILSSHKDGAVERGSSLHEPHWGLSAPQQQTPVLPKKLVQRGLVLWASANVDPKPGRGKLSSRSPCCRAAPGCDSGSPCVGSWLNCVQAGPLWRMV